MAKETMEKLLQYFIEDTNRRFSELQGEVRGGLTEVNQKLDDLQKFKIEMIASARLTALIVSGICGAVTLAVTVFAIIPHK